jgi:hypothetical protein
VNPPPAVGTIDNRAFNEAAAVERASSTAALKSRCAALTLA